MQIQHKGTKSPYFVYYVQNPYVEIMEIKKWLGENCKGRTYLCSVQSIYENNDITYGEHSYMILFENDNDSMRFKLVFCDGTG